MSQCNATQVNKIERDSTKIFNKITQGTDISLRRETERFDSYDVTASSGNSSTILLIEIKKRNVDFGKYDSTFLEQYKFEDIMGWVQQYRREYPNYRIVPVLLTLFNNNIHTLHKMENEHYISEKLANWYTLSENDKEVNKQFVNYPIFNFDRIFRDK